jgi:hypothetical protein
MAEENTRPGRGRKKDGTTDAAGKQKKATTAKARTTKAAEKTASTRARRPKLVVEPTREAIAEQAYLLWERGEPGGEADHWLRAEADLRAA